MMEIRLGDCLEGMGGLADGSVGVTLCDPPYTQRTSENARRSRWNGGDNGIDREGRFISFDGIAPADIAASLLRVTARWVIVFCALEQLGEYERAAGSAWIRSGIWDRENGAPQFTGDRPAQAAEGIAIMHNEGRKRWNRNGSRAMWAGPVEKNARAIGHPTPKPLWLMEALVSDFTDPGELVLDPFAGSGTTGVACKRLGRQFLGFERDPKFHAAAVKRLEAAREQYTLGLRPPKAKQTRLLP